MFDPYALIHRIDLDTAAMTARIVQTPSNGARAAVDRLSALDPNNASVYESVARLREAAGDLKGASQSIDTAIRLRPHHVRYHVLRGDLLRSLGDRTAAAGAYREEIPLLVPASPEWLNVEHRLLVTLEEAGDHGAVIAEGKIVTSTVNDDLAFTVLGLAYRSIDDRKNALEAFAAAVRINPANTNAAAGLREAEAALQRPPSAASDPKRLNAR
jgi:tetratricopeptide (TPR) repeat protein